MRTISVADAKARLSELLNEAEAGEEVVITRHGTPVARILPAQDQPRRLESLAALRAQWPKVHTGSAELVRALRDEGY